MCATTVACIIAANGEGREVPPFVTHLHWCVVDESLYSLLYGERFATVMISTEDEHVPVIDVKGLGHAPERRRGRVGLTPVMQNGTDAVGRRVGGEDVSSRGRNGGKARKRSPANRRRARAEPGKRVTSLRGELRQNGGAENVGGDGLLNEQRTDARNRRRGRK